MMEFIIWIRKKKGSACEQQGDGRCRFLRQSESQKKLVIYVTLAAPPGGVIALLS